MPVDTLVILKRAVFRNFALSAFCPSRVSRRGPCVLPAAAPSAGSLSGDPATTERPINIYKALKGFLSVFFANLEMNKVCFDIVMKKYLIAFLIVATSNCCFGQGGKFQLYLTKSCSTVQLLDTSYYLTPINRFDTSYSPKAGTVYLPKAGRYVIGFNSGPLLDSSIIDIKDTGIYVYRYKEPIIQLYVTGAYDSPPIYVKCDTPINGYQESLFPNGSLKMQGNFKDGYPKDSIITFYNTGTIKKRIIISPKIVNIEEYDSLGKLIKLSHNQNKTFMTYSEYRWTEFYPNGKVKSEQSSIKRVEKIDEFYPTGQLKVRQTKNKRIEYYENGTKSVTYNWYGKKDDIEKERKNFTIYKIEYDTTGEILQSTVFEIGNSPYPQPELDISRADLIVSFKKYKDGKEILNIEDMETKKFVEKYGEDRDK